MDAGSRMHVLDLLDSPEFLPTLRSMVVDVGFQIDGTATWQPKGRHNDRESVLTGTEDPFLSSSQRTALTDWWLVHKRGAKLPTWDLVSTALSSSGAKALILVEAKAHASEFSTSGKIKSLRKTLEEQARTDANHERIAEAIKEASAALGATVRDVALTQDISYQFANRLAFAWKLASMGIPVALVYLGFIGDTAISRPGDFFASDEEWRTAFVSHTAPHFPSAMLGQEIVCGAASFWLAVRSLPVRRISPDASERRVLG